MSTSYSSSQSHRLPYYSERLTPFTIYLSALVLARLADIVTTYYGLRAVESLVEKHPVVAAVMAEIGIVPALLLLGSLSVVITAVGTELAAYKAHDFDPEWGPAVTRIAGYGAVALLYFGAAVWNLHLIMGVA